MKGANIMTNVAGILKAEISRISRKEAKAALKEISNLNMNLKKTVVDLKRRLTQLERDNKRLKATQAKQQPATPQVVAEEGKRARLTSKGVRSLRKKLRLTRPDFAKLLGTSPQSVYMWETKEGDLKLRPKTKTALLSLRGIGVREAKRRLAEGQEEVK
jgi:DNA-binding transcriptional regulator YiaG